MSENPPIEKPPIAALNWTNPAGEKKLIPLHAGQTLRIGRVPGNDIVLEDVKISRFHAVFNVASAGVVVSDLASLNGTHVNGRRITTPTPLKGGDLITIGDSSFLLEQETDSPTISGEAAQQTQAASLRAVVVTVLVADVCGYTRISESVPSREVALMLQRWFEMVSDTVRAHGGEVNKYIGDAVMAIWQGSREEAAQRAKQATEAAAIILRETPLHSAQEGWAYQGDYPWVCRVCLNTGEALQGIFGSSMSRDFTVLGDTVNVAFRLEGIAKTLQHKFVVSQATADLIQDSFRLSNLGSVNAKGKSEPLTVFGVETA